MTSEAAPLASAHDGARAPAEEPLVATRALSKYYVRGDQVIPVLVDINLDVYAGDYVALMGPSGSGKRRSAYQARPRATAAPNRNTQVRPMASMMGPPRSR